MSLKEIDNTCLGVISWLPDRLVRGEEIRKSREKSLNETLLFLSKNFPSTDIIIVAQSWDDFKIPNISNKVILYRFNKALGIIKARKYLRKVFLDSKYDNIIMADDDINIEGFDVDKYINEIRPNGAGFIKDVGMLNLACMSKYIYSKIDFPSIEHNYFEDEYVREVCYKYYPENTYFFNSDFKDRTVSKNKSPSTWWGENKSTKISFYQNNREKLVNEYKVIK